MEQAQHFDYLLVLDFEATCEQNKQLDCQEIIEFPVVVIDVKTNEILQENFHYYIKPIVNPQLTKFCTELTGITQQQVDNGISLQQAIQELDKFLQIKKILNTNFTFVTCGDFDLNKCLKLEAVYKNITYPNYLLNYINLKAEYPKQYYPKNMTRALPDMVEMLQGLNINLDGRHHSGIDDAKNIAKVAQNLLSKGFKFTKNMVRFVNIEKAIKEKNKKK